MTDAEVIDSMLDRLSGGKGATPRPWELAERGAYSDFDGDSRVIIGDDMRIAVVHTDGQPETEANAALIVKAVNAYDDMLAALCEYVDFGASSKAYEMGRAAIAKAKGAAP